MKSKWNCAGVVESEKIFSSETLTIKRIMDTSWLIVASSPSLRFFSTGLVTFRFIIAVDLGSDIV